MIKNLLHIFIIFFLSTNLFAKSEYVKEGIDLYNKNKFEDAKFKFEQDIVFNPKNENSYLYLAKIFNFKKNDNLEEKNLNTVILLNPLNEEATFYLAKLRLRESDFEGSKKLIDQLNSFCDKYCEKNKEIKIEVEKSLKK